MDELIMSIYTYVSFFSKKNVEAAACQKIQYRLNLFTREKNTGGKAMDSNKSLKNQNFQPILK